MKAVIAVDSFKESMTSMQAGEAIRTALQQVFPEAEAIVLPLADGGEGTVDTMVEGMRGRTLKIRVTGPLGDPVWATYGVFGENNTAVIEMAAAAGIELVPEEQKDPRNTTTYGIGEMIMDALDRGCREFIIGIGGSATNDGGMGMLQALGCLFFNAEGTPVGRFGRDMMEVASVDMSGLDPRLSRSVIRVACDVTNPLCGPQGASAVYGPQKGATPEMVQEFDAALASYAEIVSAKTGTHLEDLPGSGAAGGLGYAFAAVLGGRLQPGAEIILETVGIAQAIDGADLVITGEGRLDAQTVMGKAPIAVAKIGKQHGAIVLAFCGCTTEGTPICNKHGIDAYFPILQKACSLEEALKPENAVYNLTATAVQAFHLLRIGMER